MQIRQREIDAFNKLEQERQEYDLTGGINFSKTLIPVPISRTPLLGVEEGENPGMQTVNYEFDKSNDSYDNNNEIDDDPNDDKVIVSTIQYNTVLL